MFGFFKKKKPTRDSDLILSLSDQDFILAVKDLILEGPPNAQVMRVIAFKNLEIVIKAMSAVRSKQPDEKCPKTIEDHIRFLDPANVPDPTNEVASRRMAWFFQAALLIRAQELSKKQSCYADTLAEIWIAIAEGCYCLPHLIETIIIWDDDEKLWFRGIRQEIEAVRYCLNFVCPEKIRKLKIVRDYAEAKGIYLIF